MKFHVLCVGRPKAPLAVAIAEYERRASRYFDLQVVEVKSGRGSPDDARRREAETLLARLPERSRSFALTRTGARMTTRDLAGELRDLAVFGPSEAVWLIGGAFGLDDAVLERVDRRVSLSDFTLPHELARLVLAEQLYRTGTILRGEPYHKGNG